MLSDILTYYTFKYCFDLSPKCKENHSIDFQEMNYCDINAVHTYVAIMYECLEK